MTDRRSLLAGATLATLMGGTASAASAPGAAFGIFGKLKVQPNARAAVAGLMLAGTGHMPGCLSYIVAEDATALDTIWVFEAWADKKAHEASLRLPVIRGIIAATRPFITGVEAGTELRVLGGLGVGSF